MKSLIRLFNLSLSLLLILPMIANVSPQSYKKWFEDFYVYVPLTHLSQSDLKAMVYDFIMLEGAYTYDKKNLSHLNKVVDYLGKKGMLSAGDFGKTINGLKDMLKFAGVKV